MQQEQQPLTWPQNRCRKQGCQGNRPAGIRQGMNTPCFSHVFSNKIKKKTFLRSQE